MKFFDHFFEIPELDNYSISGLNKELTCINIYDTFIKDNKGVLVVASSTYVANLLYQTLLNYTDKVLFFPMDDFLTSEAIAISPEFKVERINTLNIISNDDKYIVVTNLMGALRYLPNKELWKKSQICLKKGMEIDREKLLNSLYDLGYEREVLVNGTGKIGVRGYVIDIFPTSYENAVRIEFWGDTIDSIKYFDVESQLSLDEIDEVMIYPFTEFILDKYDEGIERKQKYLAHYSNNISSIMGYFDKGIVCYYDYDMLVKSYELLISSIEEYDNENKSNIDTNYMFSLADIHGDKTINYYHYDEGLINKKNNYQYSYNSINKYNGDYNIIKEDFKKYINDGKTIILCIDNKSSAKRIANYLEIDDIILTDETKIINKRINLINKNVYEGFIYGDYVILGRNDLFNQKEEIIKYKNNEKDYFEYILKSNNLTDFICISNKKDYKENENYLLLSNMFYSKNITYSYEEYKEHLKSTKEYAKNNKNYKVIENKFTTFKNITITICGNNYVIIHKNANPTIHFVIRHPKLVDALKNFNLLVKE